MSQMEEARGCVGLFRKGEQACETRLADIDLVEGSGGSREFETEAARPQSRVRWIPADLGELFHLKERTSTGDGHGDVVPAHDQLADIHGVGDDSQRRTREIEQRSIENRWH